MNIDFSFLNNLVLVILVTIVSFLSALWLALVIWTWRDIHDRTHNTLTQVTAVLVVAVLYVPGILIYMILRPVYTIEEDYQKSLEEEALLVSIKEQAICPGCERHVREDWQICPNCRTKLKKKCQNCEKLMELQWDTCPYCGTNSPFISTPTPIDNETKGINQPTAERKDDKLLENNVKSEDGDEIIYFDSLDELDELSGYQKFKVIENLEKEQDSGEETK